MVTRYYEIGLSVPANTPASSPATTVANVSYPPIQLPAGEITGLLITVSSGAGNAIFFRIKLNGSVIFPTGANQQGWSNLSNVVAQYIPFSYHVDSHNAELNLEAYNTSSSAYVIVIGIIMEV